MTIGEGTGQGADMKEFKRDRRGINMSDPHNARVIQGVGDARAAHCESWPVVTHFILERIYDI